MDLKIFLSFPSLFCAVKKKGPEGAILQGPVHLTKTCLSNEEAVPGCP